ncbi:DUF4097 family beta strand repeat-containing protein [Longispora urticae]
MLKFDTTAPIAAVLDVPAGRVLLIAADRADATVEVLPTDASKGRDVRLAERTTVAFVDGELRIDAPGNNLGPTGSVEVTVQLPAGSRVGAKLASGEFRAVGRLGEVTFDGAHGPVKVDEAASVRITTTAGDIAVGRLGGASEVTTRKGDIHVAEAVRGAVVLRTDAGAISVGAAAGVSASMNAGTSYGRIDNALYNSEGGGAQLEIHATTGYGDITARSL